MYITIHFKDSFGTILSKSDAVSLVEVIDKLPKNTKINLDFTDIDYISLDFTRCLLEFIDDTVLKRLSFTQFSGARLREMSQIIMNKEK